MLESMDLSSNPPVSIVHRKTYYVVSRCDGEAHSNTHIDNCSTCAPSWGVKVRLEETGERPSRAVYQSVVQKFRRMYPNAY